MAAVPLKTIKIEGNPSYARVQSGEEFDQIVTVSGRGWGCVLDEAIIYPEFDLNLPLDSSWRLFSFASPSFPNGAAWPGSTQLYEYQDGVTEGLRYQAVIVGGLESIIGAVLGGLVIGLLEGLAQYFDSEYLHFGNLITIAPFYAMLLILMIKPYGLFGTKNIERV